MEVQTGAAVPAPSPLGGFLDLLTLLAAHHDPSNDTTIKDMDRHVAAMAATVGSNGLVPLLSGLAQSLPAILALIEALTHHAKVAEPQAPAVTEHPDPVPPVLSAPVVVTNHAPHASGMTPPADDTVVPTSLRLDLDLWNPGNQATPFEAKEQDDHYDIVKTEGTTNLPIHGGAYLHAGYDDAQGPINWTDPEKAEYRPGVNLFRTARWTATVISSTRPARVGMKDVIQASVKPDGTYGDAVRTSNNVANFQAAEYNRTGGMDVPVHFPPECDEEVIQIDLEFVPTGLTTKGVRFPKVS